MTYNLAECIGLVCVDENYDIEWQSEINKDTMTYWNAVKYAEELDYAGHNDWRLPTVDEMMTIPDELHKKTAIYNRWFWVKPLTNIPMTRGQVAFLHRIREHIITGDDINLSLDSNVICVRDI